MARIDIPSNLTLARIVVESQTQTSAKALEMGWIGRVFGNAVEKPGNIAGAAIIVSFVVLISVVIASIENPSFKTDALIPVFTGIITLALGYLFGKSTGG